MEKIFLLLPLVPYFKVLTEIINPIAFLLVSLIVIVKYRRKLVKLDLYFIAILILGLISIFLSKDKVLSFLDSFYVLIFVPAFIIGSKLSNKERDKITVNILYGGIIASILSIIRYLTNTDVRLDGLLNYANTSALYFGICSVIFFSEGDLFKKNIEKYLVHIGIVFVIAALLLTQSRGAIIIYAAAVLYIAFARHENRQAVVSSLVQYNLLGIMITMILFYRQYVIFVLALPFIIFFAIKKINIKIKANVILYSILGLAFIGGIFSLSRINLDTFKERLIFYKDGLTLLKHNLLGIGAGRFSYEQFANQTAAYDIKYIHNGFLQIAIDYGIIFFIIYISILFYILFKKFNKKRLSQLSFIIPIMILVHSLVDFSMSFSIINLILWFYLSKLEENVPKKKGTVINKQEIHRDGYSQNKSYVIVTALIAVLNLIIIVFVPGELIYNIATFNKNSYESSYTVLKSWSKFPLKTVRYYDKLSALDFQLYSDKKDIKYLNEAVQNLGVCLSVNGDNARINELLGKTYFGLGNYSKAAQSLEKSVEERKYYLSNYDALIECYYNLYKKNYMTGEEYYSKLQGIGNRIISLGNEVDSRSKFMKNQPDGKLNEYERKRINEAESLINRK